MQTILDFLAEAFQRSITWWGSAIGSVINAVYNANVWLLDAILTVAAIAWDWMYPKLLQAIAWVWAYFEAAWHQYELALVGFVASIADNFPSFPSVYGIVNTFLDLPTILAALSVCIGIELTLMTVKIILKLFPGIY